MKKYSLLVLVLLLSALFTLPAYANTQDSQGDINRDHIVNADDALAVLKHVAILDTMGSSEMRRADVNRDQTIDAKDALNVLKYAVGLINTYDEYIKCIKSLEDKAIDDYSVVSHYDEKYFEENVLVVANYVDSSHSIESSYLNTTNYEDRFVVNIEQIYPEILFEGANEWYVFIPLEGKEWNEKKAGIDYKTQGGRDVICRAETMWVSTYFASWDGVVELPKYSIISTYEEYKDYTDFIGGNRLWTNIASYNATRYNEAYFEDNVLILVVVDGTENPYNADVISTITDDGEIILDIDRYHNVRNNGRIWNIFVPLPGTNWIADNVTINYTDSYPE